MIVSVDLVVYEQDLQTLGFMSAVQGRLYELTQWDRRFAVTGEAERLRSLLGQLTSSLAPAFGPGLAFVKEK